MMKDLFVFLISSTLKISCTLIMRALAFSFVQRHFPATPACTSSSQDGVLFSTTNLPLFVRKTSSTLPSGRGNKSVAREIALCRQCSIQKLWSCDNCPLVFMQ